MAAARGKTEGGDGGDRSRRRLLLHDIRTLYRDDAVAGGRAAAAVLTMTPAEVAVLAESLSDDPALLMATLDALPTAATAAPGGGEAGRRNWRGELQERIQRRIRRTPTERDLAVRVAPCRAEEDTGAGPRFVATVTIGGEDLAPVVAEGTPQPSKQAAIQSAARAALLRLEHPLPH